MHCLPRLCFASMREEPSFPARTAFFGRTAPVPTARNHARVCARARARACVRACVCVCVCVYGQLCSIALAVLLKQAAEARREPHAEAIAAPKADSDAGLRRPHAQRTAHGHNAAVVADIPAMLEVPASPPSTSSAVCRSLPSSQLLVGFAGGGGARLAPPALIAPLAAASLSEMEAARKRQRAQRRLCSLRKFIASEVARQRRETLAAPSDASASLAAISRAAAATAAASAAVAVAAAPAADVAEAADSPADSGAEAAATPANSGAEAAATPANSGARVAKSRSAPRGGTVVRSVPPKTPPRAGSGSALAAMASKARTPTRGAVPAASTPAKSATGSATSPSSTPGRGTADAAAAPSNTPTKTKLSAQQQERSAKAAGANDRRALAKQRAEEHAEEQRRALEARIREKQSRTKVKAAVGMPAPSSAP